MTPDQIYLRAVAAERARPLPAYVRYDVAFRANGATIGCPHGRIVITFGSNESKADYRVTYRADDESIRSIDRATGETCEGAPLIAPAGSDIAKLLQATTAPQPRASDAGATIATVRAYGVARYAVVSSTDEILGSRHVYHLAIHALADPETYPLTDLYVDEADYRICRITGHFVDRFGGAAATIVATGDFERYGPYSIQTHEHVEFAAETQPHRTRAALDATASGIAVDSDARETAVPDR